MKRPLGWLVGAVALVGMAVAVLAAVLDRDRAAPPPMSVAERLAVLKAERASLQARAEGEGRVALLASFRVASLLIDALAIRAEEGTQPLDRLTAPRRLAFAEAEALNVALADAVARPAPGAVLAARRAAERAQTALERLADNDALPLVLAFTPRFIAPRRSTGELTVLPSGTSPPPHQGTLAIHEQPRRTPGAAQPTVPRYAPGFVASADDEPAVLVEIAGLRLASGEAPPVLTVGAWRGVATVAPERLRFTVPRQAFATDAARTTLVTATLAVRSEGRPAFFELPFVVLPDRPGSIAVDQKVRATSSEATALVSPEILVRAAAGETHTVRRCFDPPEGTRFDKQRRRVIVVERLAWVNDVSDPASNAGTVEFAHDEGDRQICLLVTARAATKAARTATIGRFEATLLRDKVEEKAERSGVRALDWREPTRIAIDPDAVEWRLYLRLFDELDREFHAVPRPTDVPFLHVSMDADGRTMILRADPAAEP
jgi:hypothetical protein